VILILVARGEAGDSTTRGAVRAARELLGSELDVKVRENDVLASDEQAIELGKAMSANAVVQLSWESADHREARIHFHFEPRPGWNDRLIVFSAGDDPAERGRTIGFAVASMMPASTPSSDAPPRPAGVARQERENPAWSASPSEPAAPRRGRGSLDVVGPAATGIMGEASGWGGAASGRWFFRAPFAVRAGFSARTGQIAIAEAVSLHIHLAAGLAWSPTFAAETPFDFGARLSFLAMREQLTHFDYDDPTPVPASRWLPGAEVAVEGSWRFNPTAGLVAAAATEVAFGHTDVTMHREKVATIPPIRLVLQAGVRASF